MPSAELAEEAAWALAELAELEPMALVPACRRLLDRHAGCGPLWWLAAHVLTAADAAEAAVACAMALEDDPTPQVVESVLAGAGRVVRRGALSDVAGADAVVVQADALGTAADGGHAGAVVDAGAARLVASAAQLGVAVWLVAGVGCTLPPRLWRAVLDRLDERPAEATGMSTYGAAGPVVLGLDAVSQVIGPSGSEPVVVALRRPTCGEPAELLGNWQRLP